MLNKKTHDKITKLLSRLPLRIVIPVTFTLIAVFTVALIFDRPIQFSYGGVTCERQVTFLPGLSKPSSESDFAVQTTDTLVVAGLELVSLKTCFIAKTAPQVGLTKASVAPLGGWLGKTVFVLDVSEPPIAYTDVFTKPVPTTKPLTISLSGADTVFDYQLEVGGKTASCEQKDSTVLCDIASMKLAQGQQYSAQLVRMFDDEKVETVAKENMTMLSATNIVSSSVQEGQIVYDKPKSFTIEFDKAVVNAKIALTKVDGDTRTEVSSTATFSDRQATITVTDELARSVKYELSIDKLEAQDGSTLVDPHKTTFTVSGGPKVTAVNVGKTGVALTQTVVLTFDQPLSDTQDIKNFVSVKGLGASISKKDNQVFVSYANAARCVDFRINILVGLQSKHDVPQGEAWSFGARTICHSTSVIGYSVNGRPIIAYIFGTGTRTVLYTGSIHGNELSAKRLMLAWVDELEANARNIPADKQIIVVPALNPDGVAAGIRNNSNNVDLNRNFDTSDWQKDITSPSNQPIENGGGVTPMSEPETKAIAAYTSRLRPRLTMSYHSIAGYVIANQGGDSSSLAVSYAQMTGYRNMTGTSGAFDYAISGTYDDWIREKLGLPSVLIELASSTYSEFPRNKAALWAMARS